LKDGWQQYKQYVEHKHVQNIASDSYETSGSNMIKQNYSKQNTCYLNRVKSSIEMDMLETPKQLVVTLDCSRIVDYITEASKKWT
jgi:hypothetical protein